MWQSCKYTQLDKRTRELVLENWFFCSNWNCWLSIQIWLTRCANFRIWNSKYTAEMKGTRQLPAYCSAFCVELSAGKSQIEARDSWWGGWVWSKIQIQHSLRASPPPIAAASPAAIATAIAIAGCAGNGAGGQQHSATQHSRRPETNCREVILFFCYYAVQRQVWTTFPDYFSFHFITSFIAFSIIFVNFTFFVTLS